MAQSLLSKYVWIIDTIYKADRISFKELNSRWLDSEWKFPNARSTTGDMPSRICSDYSLRMKARVSTATIL